ncbi:site-2 protease family protein [Streptomyces sp. NRRL S-474]|uniref:site-2 protease family protein n=1 Tax=Streptomyces sp. NRRL S-474 TaxID=1463909 RepID=UPI0004CA7DEA|nr:site-2 protease family protein [Streptomyces sp. NRRL S-474]
MDESGGRGQPRSGNDESAERHAGPPARATDPTPADERPAEGRRFTPERDDDAASATPQPEEHTGSGGHSSARAPRAAGSAPDRAPATGDRPAGQAPGPTADSATGQDTDGPQPPPRPASSADASQTRPGRADSADGSQAPRGPADSADDRQAPRGPADSAGGSAAQAGPEPSRYAGADGSGAAPAQGERDGTRSPEGDTHPDRSYARGPHAAPAPGEPDADRRPTAPAQDAAGPHRRPEPPAPADRPLAHSADGKGPAPQRPPEPRGGLLMGRPFGVPVYVAPSWFLVAALITWVFGGQLERVLPELGAARYLVSLFFAVAFYASVLVHELAHTVAALRFKLPVRRIQLQFFGGVSEIEKEAETPGREFVLAFVGPLLSLVLAGVFYGALQAVEPGTVPAVLLAGLMISNLIVAAFNLLPGLPLDGGRMLRAVVWKLTGKPMSGTVVAAWVGRFLAVSVLIGLPLLTQSGALGTDAADNVGMDTVLDALLAAILAAIIWTGAGNSLRMARLREHLPELRARALTRRAVPVESHTPLSEALRRANSAGARALVVVDANGSPVSLVREAAIAGVPEHRRPWVAVSGLAQELTDGMRVSAELSGEELLDALRATPATEYLVVEETGEIYGVLSAADVERAFVKAMARPS